MYDTTQERLEPVTCCRERGSGKAVMDIQKEQWVWCEGTSPWKSQETWDWDADYHHFVLWWWRVTSPPVPLNGFWGLGKVAWWCGLASQQWGSFSHTCHGWAGWEEEWKAPSCHSWPRGYVGLPPFIILWLLQNCTCKVVRRINFMVCVSYHNKKISMTIN